MNLLGTLPVVLATFLLCFGGTLHARVSIALVVYCLAMGLTPR